MNNFRQFDDSFHCVPAELPADTEGLSTSSMVTRDSAIPFGSVDSTRYTRTLEADITAQREIRDAQGNCTCSRSCDHTRAASVELQRECAVKAGIIDFFKDMIASLSKKLNDSEDRNAVLSSLVMSLLEKNAQLTPSLTLMKSSVVALTHPQNVSSSDTASNPRSETTPTGEKRDPKTVTGLVKSVLPKHLRDSLFSVTAVLMGDPNIRRDLT
jgi:hypothetical protein